MSSDNEHLKEKARLLLQRERELFALRKKHEQLAVWLSIGQALPQFFLNCGGGLDEVWNRIRRTFLGKLRLQRVLLLELSDSLRALAPAGPDLPLPSDVRALLDAQRWGLCNDPSASSNPPGVAALAESVGLHRFVWSRIARTARPSILIVGGFDRVKAAFQPPFEETDGAHFSNAAQHVESLLANALLIAELESEKDQLRQANLTLEQRDRALLSAAEELQAANESLEHRVRERTLELAERNRDLRLVLDNVDQALLTVDLEGRLAPERSSVFDRWFGAYTGRPRFLDHVKADPQFVARFELGLYTLRDGALPQEIGLEQMPVRLVLGDRHFDCRYLPIGSSDALLGLLLVVDDITERLARAREDAEQRELLAAFTALTRDRKGFLTFFEESERMFGQLAQNDLDKPSEVRLLHTLKGNAASFELQVLADLCHLAESELASNSAVTSEVRQRLRMRWAVIVETVHAVVPAELRKTIEISEHDLERLAGCARRGASGSQIIEALNSLSWEPVERPLGRLAQHARVLAARLGKGDLDLPVDADRIRLDPVRWAPLWSTLIHFVRNAVDHGIEPCEERRSAGKSKTGRLRLSARSLERGFRLEVEDNGRGIDWDTVRRICLERGLPSASHTDLVNAILSPGFTTRRELTETSGRGAGLAAAAALVQELGGELAVESAPSTGTRWTLTFTQSSTDSIAKF